MTTPRPGTVTPQPFEWPEPASQVHRHPTEPSAIIQLLGREPALFERLAGVDFPTEAARREP